MLSSAAALGMVRLRLRRIDHLVLQGLGLEGLWRATPSTPPVEQSGGGVRDGSVTAAPN